MVRSRRLELPRHFCHSDLNAARLPIPPRPQFVQRADRQPEVRCQTRDGGAKEDRTPDLYNAIVALSQLSYGPTFISVQPQHRQGVGALGGTRTPTAFQPLGPEPSASTNSATSASRVILGDCGEADIGRTGPPPQAKFFTLERGSVETGRGSGKTAGAARGKAPARPRFPMRTAPGAVGGQLSTVCGTTGTPSRSRGRSLGTSERNFTVSA